MTELSPKTHMHTPNIEHHLPAEQFLMQANPKKFRCVDERQPDEKVMNDGVAIPGAIYGIVDTIKTINRVSEEVAWKTASDAGLPMDAHMDEHHHERGCGYGKLVEDEPAAVGAVESVPAKTRKHTADQHGGEIITLLGDHAPTKAVINYRTDTTIDTRKALADKQGIFDLDAWALPNIAKQLHMDPVQFSDHVIEVYKKTVTQLTGITQFQEIR
jgi:hypothetical protein